MPSHQDGDQLEFGTSADKALVELGLWLRQLDYRFITPTPATHGVINARPESRTAKSREDVFGWSRPFHRALLPENAIKLLEHAEALAHDGDLLRSKVRFSTLRNLLLVHSSFPTTVSDAVFFGPDTYRFARFIEQTFSQFNVTAPDPILDMGCGTGAGGLFVKSILPRAGRVILADINSQALHYAWVNAKLAGSASVTFCQGDLFRATPEHAALIVANPPYVVDDEARVYRNGGGFIGTGLSARVVREGLPRLKPGGTMILYTGVPIIDGEDTLMQAVGPDLQNSNFQFSYEEIDPDVFGEELLHARYAGVDRIAAVGLVVRKGQAG